MRSKILLRSLSWNSSPENLQGSFSTLKNCQIPSKIDLICSPIKIHYSSLNVTLQRKEQFDFPAVQYLSIAACLYFSELVFINVYNTI